jgi:hypothetical protein
MQIKVRNYLATLWSSRLCFEKVCYVRLTPFVSVDDIEIPSFRIFEPKNMNIENYINFVSLKGSLGCA